MPVVSVAAAAAVVPVYVRAWHHLGRRGGRGDVCRGLAGYGPVAGWRCLYGGSQRLVRRGRARRLLPGQRVFTPRFAVHLYYAAGPQDLGHLSDQAAGRVPPPGFASATP